MTPTILLGIFTVIPVALVLLLRSNAAVVFLSLCAGSVVVKYVSENAVLAVSTVAPKGNTDAIAHIGLLLLPPVLILLILRHSISPGKLPINAIAAVALGLAMPILLVPLLPGGIQQNVMSTSIWLQLQNYQDIIIGGSTLIAIAALWLTYKPVHHHKKH